MFNPYDSADSVHDSGERADAFMELLAATQGRLFGYIFALVPNSADAQDLYQQTVMALWRKFDQFESGTNFAAWALKAAYYEVMMYRRSSARSKLQFDDEIVAILAQSQQETVMAEGEKVDRVTFLNECLGHLSGRDLELVKQCYLQKLSIKQVAESMERTSQSICNSLRRIRQVLLKCIDSKMEERTA